MCDTSVAAGSATADGSVIFAKNSDRPANECQPLEYYPRQQYPANTSVRCTHREIPQVRETAAVLGCRPYWIWGFETGVNEHGVAIGNEGVYGRGGFEDGGLLGMDYLRLGLERATSADEALHVMVDLLERYGQGGNADLSDPHAYHNSFIIADPTGAWVLETAGRYWAAQRVRGRRAISNCFTIGTTWDEASKDLVDHAVAKGWWQRGTDFDFALAYGKPDWNQRSGRCRFRRATDVLASHNKLDVPHLIDVVRDHGGLITGEDGIPIASPAICMHCIPPRKGKTASSVVAQLRPITPAPLHAVVWHSFGSPCLSAFRPFYPSAGPAYPDLAIGGDRFDPASPWWRKERVQRRLDAYPTLKPIAQVVWQRAERAAFTSAEQAEQRVRGLSAAEASAELRRLSDELVCAGLDTLRVLDDTTARHAASLPPLAGADVAHWAALNDPVGLHFV